MLARGDKQIYSGKSEGPVARFESLLVLLSIAILYCGEAFKGTPMADDVKHKWVRLDKIVAQILMQLQPGNVRMRKLAYEYVKEALVEKLMETFGESRYTVSKKDKCVFIRREEVRVAFYGTKH